MQTYFEKFNSEASELLGKARKILAESADYSEFADKIPTSLSNDDKCINVVFAGQYSAGKSSLLSILTGKQLATGGGITTAQCETFKWQGINVTDTPGIHTQNRPDHDAITYDQLAKADLIVFVVTAEGFSEHLANHFRKLIFELRKGHEMMLVVNKMDRTANGNTPEQQSVLLQKDILPVIAPYSAEDLYTTFICTDWYKQAFEPKYAKYQEKLIEKSGIQTLVENLNKFITDKGLLGKSTTALYQAEKVLREIIDNIKLDDPLADGAVHILNEKRRILMETEMRIREKVNNAVGKAETEIQSWGNEVANKLSSLQQQEETNHALKEKQVAVEKRADKLTNEVEEIVKNEVSPLQKELEDLFNTEFAKNLQSAIKANIKSVNISDNTKHTLEKTSKGIGDASKKIISYATGPNAPKNLLDIFKMKTYSGSKMHDLILKTGHLVGHKFNPWEPTRWAKNIANASRVANIAAAGLTLVLQIYNDKQEDKIEQELTEGRMEIRTCFADAAKAIELEYNGATDSWIQKEIAPHIKEVDSSISEIVKECDNTQILYKQLYDLLLRIRQLIDQMQTAG